LTDDRATDSDSDGNTATETRRRRADVLVPRIVRWLLGLIVASRHSAVAGMHDVTMAVRCVGNGAVTASMVLAVEKFAAVRINDDLLSTRRFTSQVLYSIDVCLA